MKTFNCIRIFFRCIWTFQIIVFVMCGDSNTTLSNVTKAMDNGSNLEDELSLKDLETRVDYILNKASKLVLPYLVGNGPTIPVSGGCMSSLMKIFLDAKNLKNWAIRMIDSIGKPAGGVLDGTILFPGDYDECLKISVDKKGETPDTKDDELFRGKYCMVQVYGPKAFRDVLERYMRNEINDFFATGKFNSLLSSFPKFRFEIDDIHLRWGVCIPSACSTEDLEILLKKGLPLDYLGFSATVYNCEVKKKREITIEQILILAAFATVGLIAIIGTSVDAYFIFTVPDSANDAFISRQKKPIQILLNCSIARTTKRILNTDENERHIGCIRGMITLGICGVVVMHSYYFFDENFYFNTRKLINYTDFMKEPLFAFIVNLPIMVDMFFCISGYLITFINGKRKKQTSRKLNIKGIIIRRFFRFSPCVLTAVGMFLLIPLFRKGPSFSLMMDVPLSACRRMWWANMLFINNLFPLKDHCLLHTWFIACLMQLVVLGVMFNWLVRRWPKTAITFHFFILVACNVAIGVLTLTMPYPPAVSLYFIEGTDMMEHFLNRTYVLPFYHACPFIIGQLAGYWSSKHPEVKLKWYTVAFSWLLFLASTFGLFLCLYPYNEGQRMGDIEAFFYAVFHRIIFAFLVTWFIFACTNGYAGFLNDILSAKVFIPLHKLGFMAYLNHGIIIYFYAGTARERIFAGHMEKILTILGYISASFLLAFGIHIVVDGPFSLVDIIIPPTSAKHPVTKSPQHPKPNEWIITEISSITKKTETVLHTDTSKNQTEDKSITVTGADNETFIYNA